jgi:hypothetical protein
MHVGQHHHVHLPGRISRRRHRGDQRCRAHARVEQHKLGPCIHQRGRKEELRLVGGNVVGGRGGSELLWRDVQTEDLVRSLDRPRPAQKGGHLERTQLEAVELRLRRPEHVSSGAGRAGQRADQGQRCGGQKGVAAG